MKKVVLICIGICVLCFAFGYIFNDTKFRFDHLKVFSPRITATKAYSFEAADGIFTSASIEQKNIIDITSEVAAKVVKIECVEGGYVEKGYPIILLERKDSDENLTLLSEKVRQARVNHDTSLKLFKSNLISKSSLQKAADDLDNAESDLKAFSQKVKEFSILAPFSGYVEKIYSRESEIVVAGKTKLVRLTSYDNFLLSARLSKKQVDRLPLNQQIYIHLNSLVVSGQILDISNYQNDKDEEDLVAKIVLHLTTQDQQKDLRAIISKYNDSTEGIKLFIEYGKIKAYSLPPSSLVISKNGDVGVNTISDDGIVLFKKVTILRIAEEGALLTGIENGDLVIVDGADFLSDNDIVSKKNIKIFDFPTTEAK